MGSDHAKCGVVPYASGEDRLRELGGLSERVRSGVDAGVVSTSQRDPIADDGYDAEVGGGVARGGCASAAVSAPRRCTPSSSPPSSTTSTHRLGSPMSSPASPSCRTPVCTNSCPETGKPSGTRPWPRRPTVTSRSVFERPGPAGADLTSRGTRRMGTSYLEVEQVGPVDAERVLAVVEELRFEAGLTASDASPDGVRVAQMLRSAIVPVGKEEAERHPAAKLLIDAIEDVRREVRAGVRQPAWMNRVARCAAHRARSDPTGRNCGRDRPRLPGRCGGACRRSAAQCAFSRSRRPTLPKDAGPVGGARARSAEHGHVRGTKGSGKDHRGNEKGRKLSGVSC